MVVDFGKNPTIIPTLSVNNQLVERVESHRYLGTIIDHRLTFQSNSETIFSKCQQRLFFLRKLRRLQVHQSVLTAYYKCFIESVITFNISAWFGSLSNIHRNPLNKIITMSSKIIGLEQESLINIYNRRVKLKGTHIASDITHTLHSHYSLLPSGQRYRSLAFRTRRAISSFVPTSIRLMNA